MGLGPIFTFVMNLRQSAVGLLVAGEATHKTKKVRKGAEIADALQISARHHGWEMQYFRVLIAALVLIPSPGQSGFETGDEPAEAAVRPVDALGTRADQEASVAETAHDDCPCRDICNLDLIHRYTFAEGLV